jgi:Uncharacterized protein conserved in bacteria (DUF2334)
VYFCIRDDDTSFFTSPEDLERAYGEIIRSGPVSLAVVPFHIAGTSKAVPEKFRRRWTVHPLHENRELVTYLRSRVSQGFFEIMLHGYHHDMASGRPEFAEGERLAQKVKDGRQYLEDLLGTSIRVFVPPNNSIRRGGLRSVAAAGLHLGCVSGLRNGWALLSPATWRTWLKLRTWGKANELGIPWILELGDHREICGNPVTPSSSIDRNEATFSRALETDGVFCAATHYWEMDATSSHAGDPTVGEHLRRLASRARSDSRVVWQTVGEIITNSSLIA